MPKFPKGFGRRKSTPIAFEDGAEIPVESSFKVFERIENSGKSFDGGVKFTKAAAAVSGRPKTSHLEDNMFENLGKNRGSSTSNTNTASTTDNSSRLSAASTAPSSTGIQTREEWRSPHDRAYNDVPLPPLPKSSTPFSLKTAGRSMSWGRTKNTPSPSKELPREPPKEDERFSIAEEESISGRSRTVTGSSYASTATPPKIDERDLGLSLGGDFSDMFAGIGNRRSIVTDSVINRATSQSPDTLPTGPANRFPATRLNHPSHLNIDMNTEIEQSPFSWSSHHSNEGLMSNTSPPPISQATPPPAVPRHGQALMNDVSLVSNTKRPETSRKPIPHSAQRKSTVEYGESVDEDARLLRESINASRKLNEPDYSSKVRDSWALPSNATYNAGGVATSSFNTSTPSIETTSRHPLSRADEDNMFDAQMLQSASIAQQFQERAQSQPSRPANTANNKVMTPAQFERYKYDQERLKSYGAPSKDEEEEEDDDENYDDDEDEAEKNKEAAKQRRKQEAHMAVYRQQMMKVIGEQPGNQRPGIMASQSSPNLLADGRPEEGEDEDNEVPLAILQAHGFPSKSKPPTRMGSNPNLRSSAQSVAGGADGRLPVFARHLPQDPYFGAGIVNPMHRESLAFGGGATSVTSGASRSLPPGGLVGVIATEERSRAMRRGSPNTQGEYGPPPQQNGNNGMGMPPNMHGSSAGSMYNGMGPMGPMNPMMMMNPGDQAQMQMSQQMQQFMQMQMQFMQMMTSGQGPPQATGHMSRSSFGEGQRPNSAHSQQIRPGSSHQRAMTMMDPNTAPWQQQGLYPPQAPAHNGGYAPSIAPSERSNVGLPGRYRPVSHMPTTDRTSTMSGALHSWENKNGAPTVKALKKSGNVSDEDDEEGWEEMAKKREKKKSLWRTKKGKDSLQDMLGYGQ